ncbi:MAG: beta-lactamase [Candidatus Eremiobacteraeota bacterium]|nr:beta-lactamase [Candidatus Eremiobacteraeota bacterium]
MRIRSGLIVVMTFLVAPLSVQAAAAAPPQAPLRIDAAVRAKIDADVQALLTSSHSQGATIAIVAGGKMVYTRAYGLRDAEKSLPADTGTHYEIGSITKQFTAAATLQLKEAGKVDLDAPVATYLPKVPHAGEITIRQLLTHTSGMPEFVNTPGFETLAGTPVTFDQLIARVANKPLDFKPGTRWSYSSTGYIILGRIIEVVTGQSWEDYVKQNLFVRAGMIDSATIAQENQLADMARGYEYANGKTVPSKPIDESWASSAGGIVTTVADLQKWNQALSSGRIISAAGYQSLTTPVRLANGSSIGYGFGMKVDTFEGQPRIWHDGNTLGFDGSNQFFPNQGVRIIVLTNAVDGGSDEIVSRVYNDLFPAIAAAAIKSDEQEVKAVTARVEAFAAGLFAGHVDRSQMTDAFNEGLTDKTVASIASQMASLGTPAWTYQSRADQPDGPGYTYLLKFPKLTAKLIIQLDGASKKFSSLAIVPQR